MMTELVFHRSKLIALSAIALLALVLLAVVQPGAPAGIIMQPQTSESATGSPAVAAGAAADVDPADRKFTYESYRFYQGRATSSDPLANVHPADRKFYSGNYGTSGLTAERIQAAAEAADRKLLDAGYLSGLATAPAADPLANVHPADRKFYTAGYATGGAASGPEVNQTTGEWIRSQNAR